MRNEYIPVAPYIFQSGKWKGKSPCQIMFEDYRKLHWLYEKIKNSSSGSGKKEKNNLEKHLDWVIEKGETRKTKMLCPYCEENPVEFFLIEYSYGRDFPMGIEWLYCGNCRKEMGGIFYPIKFSSLLKFSLSVDRKRITRIFKQAFKLPKRTTKQILFDFFQED